MVELKQVFIVGKVGEKMEEKGKVGERSWKKREKWEKRGTIRVLLVREKQVSLPRLSGKKNEMDSEGSICATRPRRDFFVQRPLTRNSSVKPL